MTAVGLVLPPCRKVLIIRFLLMSDGLSYQLKSDMNGRYLEVYEPFSFAPDLLV